MIRRLDTRSTAKEQVRSALHRPVLEETPVAPEVQAALDRTFGVGTKPFDAVRQIVSDIQARGDAALVEYVERIDGVSLRADDLFVSDDEIAAAYREVDSDVAQALRTARDRIRDFHERQKQASWFITDATGNWLGQRVIPLERVGCYVPGGRFPLVSSALMCVVPAKVAGVAEIVAATPCDRHGRINPHMLVALAEAGAHRILRVGGAQAVAAMAYGTQSVPPVDKIVGPGNLFVQLAKKLVFGKVGIDALAGPSEILIIADKAADPEWIAADMLSQAEHDPESAAFCLATDASLAERVAQALERQLAALPSPEVAAASLARWGLILTCRDLDEAIELANEVAAEHLELMVAEPQAHVGRIRHAGAVFLGGRTSEPLGDYVAGPNHILPTNRAARFASPMGVEQFVRRSGLIQVTAEGLAAIGPAAVTLARLEGLEAHARAVEQRLESVDGLK